MKRLVLLFFIIVQATFAQGEDAWVYFKDKPDATADLANPIVMLSQRSLDRRAKQGIAIDSKDVPISLSYINQIKGAFGIAVKAKSKWLNAIHVIGSEINIKNLKTAFTFVDSIQFANKNIAAKVSSIKKINRRNNKFAYTTTINYGNATNQIEMIHGEFLHQQNFTGSGMIIAILDAGFPNVDTFAAFQRIRSNNQILGGYDFVNRNTNFYTGFSHGASVLSDIAGYVSNQFVGTAPDADFYLFITEDVSKETPLEESLWVEAAERADSLGVDVINTSLGYTTFDNANYDYTYSDMDGKTTFISRGAEIAASRGMILVNAAGNDGVSSWHYISAPADAASVLSVGAVDPSGVVASFSSYGPTSDGRIKPDVEAEGASVYVIDGSGNVATSNGTSFASPIMTGAITCLWQANPTKTYLEILNAVRESASRYANPTDHDGYGIPNFQIANQTLNLDSENLMQVKFYPNPAKDQINFVLPNSIDNIEVTLLDVLGKTILHKIINSQNSSLKLGTLNAGVYFLRISSNEKSKTFKLIKK